MFSIYSAICVSLLIQLWWSYSLTLSLDCTSHCPWSGQFNKFFRLEIYLIGESLWVMWLCWLDKGEIYWLCNKIIVSSNQVLCCGLKRSGRSLKLQSRGVDSFVIWSPGQKFYLILERWDIPFLTIWFYSFLYNNLVNFVHT
mgnify:CR=1 FL=1